MNRVSDIRNQTVIVSPLDWGLGHATRCIPIIQELIRTGNKCIIASSGRSLELLKQEFPTLVHEQIPEYGISYSTNAVSTFFKLLLSFFFYKINNYRHNLTFCCPLRTCKISFCKNSSPLERLLREELIL